MMSTTIQSRNKYLVFQASKELYGIKIDYLKEVHQPEKILKLPRTSQILSGIINLRGYIMSVFNFSVLLWGSESISDSSKNGDNNQRVVLVVNVENQQIGILADEITQLADVVAIADTTSSDLNGKKLSNPSIRTQIGTLKDDKKVLIVDLESALGNYLSSSPISDEMKIDKEDEQEDADFDLDQYTLADDDSGN